MLVFLWPLCFHASFTFMLSFESHISPLRWQRRVLLLSLKHQNNRGTEGGGGLGHRSLELLLVSLVSDPRYSLRPL